MQNKKVAAGVIVASLFIAFAILTYVLALSPLNSKGKEFSIFIPSNNTGASVEQAILDSLFRDTQTPSIVYYKWKVTSLFKSVDKFPPGKYTLSGNLSARAIFNKLLSGNQDAVSIRIDNVKTIYKLAQRFGKKFEQDSAKFMSYVNKNLDLLAPNTNELPLEIRQQRVLERLLGDTYEMYWTSSPENFFSRLNTLYDEFWTNEQDTLASRIGLTEHEVYVLASIVRGETANEDEASEIAGLYLNRLNQEMLLQSDPTVLFGINTKEKRQRVRHDDLKFDSPYNTYLYKGLPPATIHIVEKSYINAVLNASTHNYIFMCAQPGGTGKHNFAVTYAEHKEYARTYQQYLDSLDIQR
ncbi:MAG: hypothetical protein RLZZ91_931 [Bacteroidota bacterium]